MKKIFSLVLAVMMLVGVFALATSAKVGEEFMDYGEIAVVERRSVTLDAVKDDAYKSAKAIPLKYSGIEGLGGEWKEWNEHYKDKRVATDPVAEGVAYVVYDTSYIWVFVEVTDSTLVTKAPDALSSKYTEDSVEILVDWTNEGKNIDNEMPYQSRVSHEGYISARLGQSGTTMQGTAEQGSKNPVNWLQGTAVHTDKGYNVEFKITIPDDKYELLADGYISMNICINDYDSTGAEASRMIVTGDSKMGAHSWHASRMGYIKFPYAPYTADTTVLYVVLVMAVAAMVGTVTLVSLRKRAK